MDPNLDPCFFEPPGFESGSISQRNGSGSFYYPVLRIRDVYPGSRIRLFFHPGSRIRTVSIPDPGSTDPGSSSKNLSLLTPKKAKKWFLSSKKYDPGCSSRIPDPDADFLAYRIPDPGVKKAPNPGSRIRKTAIIMQK
jgi:hypothetical protein